jgi:hypothetical protein
MRFSVNRMRSEVYESRKSSRAPVWLMFRLDFTCVVNFELNEWEMFRMNTVKGLRPTSEIGNPRGIPTSHPRGLVPLNHAACERRETRVRLVSLSSGV